MEAILASNYTVKVTKGTVKGRGMFAGVDARSMQERVARNDPKGKKTGRERERERGKEGRGRCTPQCGTTPDPIASSVSVLESSRSKRSTGLR